MRIVTAPEFTAAVAELDRLRSVDPDQADRANDEARIAALETMGKHLEPVFLPDEPEAA